MSTIVLQKFYHLVSFVFVSPIYCSQLFEESISHFSCFDHLVFDEDNTTLYLFILLPCLPSLPQKMRLRISGKKKFNVERYLVEQAYLFQISDQHITFK